MANFRLVILIVKLFCLIDTACKIPAPTVTSWCQCTTEILTYLLTCQKRLISMFPSLQ